MGNAKEEFLRVTKHYNIIGANIQFDLDEVISMKLKPLYTQEEYKLFLDFLDREYDSGYGGQQLYGIIYCEDGVWIDRGEYDGQEWWNVNKYPNLRESFTENEIIRYERSKKLRNINNI